MKCNQTLQGIAFHGHARFLHRRYPIPACSVNRIPLILLIPCAFIFLPFPLAVRVHAGGMMPPWGPYTNASYQAWNVGLPAPCPKDSTSGSSWDADPATAAVTTNGGLGMSDPALPLYNSTSTNCSGTSHNAPNCDSNIVEQPAVVWSISERYAAAAEEYVWRHAPAAPATAAAPSASSSSSAIQASTSQQAQQQQPNPFLLYMPLMHMHVPLSHDPVWTNSSARNTPFGDTLMELDHTIGRVMNAIHASGVANNTLILLAGDNGPWNHACDFSGSQGPFLGTYQITSLGGGATGKFTTWEGGHRVAGIASWASVIAPGQVSVSTVSTLDFVPTVAALAGVQLPQDRQFDGVDLAPILFGSSSGLAQGMVDDGVISETLSTTTTSANTTVRDWLFHPDQFGNLTAVRYKNYKAYFQTWGSQPCGNGTQSKTLLHDPPLIFDLDADVAETQPIANPDPALVQAFYDNYRWKYANITSTFRSHTNYSQAPDANGCCDPSHVVCRCAE